MDHDAALVERAAAAVDPVMRSVRSDQLGLPTPCHDWDLRGLVDHFLGTLHRWALRLDGDPGADGEMPTIAARGDDVAAAWTSARDALLSALGKPGALDREVTIRGRTANARLLLAIMPVELMLHGWDTARAVGAPTDFDPELAEQLAEAMRPRLQQFGRGTSFAEEQPAPDTATAADRLAALAGRRVA